jgi:hypothetical protein
MNQNLGLRKIEKEYFRGARLSDFILPLLRGPTRQPCRADGHAAQHSGLLFPGRPAAPAWKALVPTARRSRKHPPPPDQPVTTSIPGTTAALRAAIAVSITGTEPERRCCGHRSSLRRHIPASSPERSRSRCRRRCCFRRRRASASSSPPSSPSAPCAGRRGRAPNAGRAQRRPAPLPVSKLRAASVSRSWRPHRRSLSPVRCHADILLRRHSACLLNNPPFSAQDHVGHSPVNGSGARFPSLPSASVRESSAQSVNHIT